MSSANIIDRVEDRIFRLKRRLIGPYRARRVRVYGIGIGKSGTHSLCTMFTGNVRAAHELQALELIEKIIDWREGRLSEDQMTAHVLERDRTWALDVDSSGLNFWLLEILMREFLDARFILTVRDCYSWFNSDINHWLRGSQPDPRWVKMQKFRLGSKYVVHEPGEQVLKEKGFNPLEAYLSHWAARHNHILATIPAEKLFIVRTDQLAQRAFEIAAFAGLPRYSICTERTHAYKNPVKQEIIRQIDRNFLEQKVEQHCRPLMTRFFPEIKSLDDAKL
jgi:sulfotransferase family protein